MRHLVWTSCIFKTVVFIITTQIRFLIMLTSVMRINNITVIVMSIFGNMKLCIAFIKQNEELSLE